MLRSRIIPCLLIHNKGLVKTVNFKEPKYVGDPLNAVRIFNEKEVDELMVIDIDATVTGREPDFEMIKNIAAECQMPFCYGGGVKTVEHAKKIIKSGAEKVALSSSAVTNPNLIQDIGKAIGVQSVVVVLDVRKKGFLGGSGYDIFIHNGKKKTSLKLNDYLRELESLGIGELVINSIDRDGTMSGYDLSLVQTVREIVSVPLTVLGGAGSHDDLRKLIQQFKIIGAAAGSLFVFKGKYRAVLISYPNIEEKKLIY